MSVGDVLFAAAQAGLTLKAGMTEDTLKAYPAARLSPELATAIKEHKADIIRILREDELMRRTGIIQSDARSSRWPGNTSAHNRRGSHERQTRADRFRNLPGCRVLRCAAVINAYGCTPRRVCARCSQGVDRQLFRRLRGSRRPTDRSPLRLATTGHRARSASASRDGTGIPSRCRAQDARLQRPRERQGGLPLADARRPGQRA